MMVGSGESSERNPTWRQRVELGTAIAGLLTALITFVVAFHSVGHANTQASNAQDAAQSSQQETRQLRSQNGQLQQQLSDAQATISDLKTSATPPTPVDTSTPTSGNGSPGVFHAGPLTVRGPHSVNLDAPPDDKQWGILGGPIGTELDIDFANQRIVSEHNYDGTTYAVMNKVPSYQDCNNETSYFSDPLSFDLLKHTPALCVITSEGRISMLKIKSITDASISFAITTYQKVGD